MAFLGGATRTDTASNRIVVAGETELTLRTVARYVRRLRTYLEGEPARLLLNLEEAKVVDVVGLAALLHAARVAVQRGISLSILPSPALYHGALDAGIAEELPLLGQYRSEAQPVEASGQEGPLDESLVVVRTDEFALRRPRWDDLTLFDQWAHDPLLKAMVGSDLLYRCRHLGAFHPEFVISVMHHATSLTLIVQATDAPSIPLGFVRLYGIHLGQGFGFLETAIVSRHALRRGWGVAASRLLSFYAQDLIGIRRIEAKAYDYNRLSINALRRNGFTQEGVLRQAAIHEGIPCDIVVFGILDEEIRAQRQKEAIPYLGLWDTAGGPFFFEASDSRMQQ